MVTETVEKEAWEVFNGVMLGDGSLTLGQGYDNAYFRIGLSGKKTLGYLLWVKDALLTIGASVGQQYPEVTKQVSRGRQYDCCLLRTGCSPLLTKEYFRWYPNSRKEVPVDIQLTPLSLAHWFMGDGGSSHSRQLAAVNVTLSTCGFSESSIRILEAVLGNLGLSISRADRHTVRGSGIIITILQDSVNKFMNMVQPYIVEPFLHKVKYRERPPRRKQKHLENMYRFECIKGIQ